MPLPAIRHITLTANQVATVSVEGDYDYVAVLHRGNVETDLWVASPGTGDPVADGDDCYLVLAGTQRVIPRPGVVGASSVRLLCTQAAKVEVEFS
jgi:hypothetical protein